MLVVASVSPPSRRGEICPKMEIHTDKTRVYKPFTRQRGEYRHTLDSLETIETALTCELRPYTAFKGRRSATSAISAIQRFDDGTKSLPSFSQPLANTLTEGLVITGDQDANLVRRHLPWEPCPSPSFLALVYFPL